MRILYLNLLSNSLISTDVFMFFYLVLPPVEHFGHISFPPIFFHPFSFINFLVSSTTSFLEELGETSSLNVEHVSHSIRE